MSTPKIPSATMPRGNSQDHIIIIGAGIVGSALAAYISETSRSPITVIDSSLNELQGSTGHAPGFVGQLNELAPLTQLAKQSVSEYLHIPGGFDRVGGLEIASGAEGITTLVRRCRLAEDAGLPAKLLTSSEISELVPQWHKPDSNFKGLYFPDDGTANPKTIVEAYRVKAKSRGVTFVEAEVLSLVKENGCITGITTSSMGLVEAAQVVVAAGIWTAQLLQPLGVSLPLIPVAHPYVHGPQRPLRIHQTPFIRWPEKHVYARDHGLFDGFGSYDHAPIEVQTLGSTAIGPWESSFGGVVAEALSLFPDVMDVDELSAFNGIFAVTPDGFPLAGPIHAVRGLWVASAVWITHATGVAQFMAEMLSGCTSDENMSRSLDPNRFSEQNVTILKEQALATYNNIYNRVR